MTDRRKVEFPSELPPVGGSFLGYFKPRHAPKELHSILCLRDEDGLYIAAAVCDGSDVGPFPDLGALRIAILERW